MLRGRRGLLSLDVPVVAEAGLKGFETGSWQGIVAAMGTPKEVSGRLNTKIVRILNTPEMKENLSGLLWHGAPHAL